MLAIPHVVFAVNKMDLVDFSAERFAEIEADLRDARRRGSACTTRARSRCRRCAATTSSSAATRCPGTTGPTLLEHLETVEIAGDRNLEDRRFPVQWVIRPMSDEHHDYRGYAGQVAGGIWRAGDEVVVLPSGRRTPRRRGRDSSTAPLEAAIRRQSVTIRLEDDIDVGRGDMLADPERPPIVARELTARALLDERAAARAAARGSPSSTRRAPSRAIVEELVSVVDMHTLEDVPSPGAARAERPRRRPAAARRAARRRPVRAQPRDRRVHPDRRGDERHGRRRDGDRRAS